MNAICWPKLFVFGNYVSRLYLLINILVIVIVNQLDILIFLSLVIFFLFWKRIQV